MTNDKTVTMSLERTLLKEASEWIKANSFGGTDAVDLWERIDTQLEAVNGAPTDEDLIEIARQSAALCSEQHRYMDRALYLDWQPHKWVIDAMRKVSAPPAPVAVMDESIIRDSERYRFIRQGTGEANYICLSSVQADMDAAIDACLDKVKELNQ